MKKKLIGLLLTSALLLLMTACGGGGSTNQSGSGNESAPPNESASSNESVSDSGNKANSDITVAVIFKALSAQYWKTMQAGCEDAANDLGINVIVLGPSTESEIAQQVTMIEEQLSAGVDALVLAPCEENAAIGALSEAVDKIPVLSVDTDFGLEGKKAFVGTGNATAAKLGGEFAAQQIGQGGKAILIGGQQGERTSTQRLEGFQQGLEENGCEVLEVQYGKNTADGAIAVMEDMLTKYPGEIGAVLCMNDDMAQGCQQAIQNAGVEGIVIVGFNGDTACVELIRDGKIAASVAQQPYMMGYQCVEQAYKAVQGEAIEANQDVSALLITNENAEEYLNAVN